MTRSTPASCAWTVAALQSRVPRPARRPASAPAPRRLRTDRGEGVISAAIAVLIVAFLGALMWVGFNTMWKNTEAKTNTQVEKIGQG